MKHASRVLARAFQDDPLWAYFFSNSAERPHKLQEIFNMFLRHAVSYGEVYATSSILEGVAVWLTSDKADISPWRIMRSGGIPVLLKMGWAEITRSMRYTEYASAIHEQCAPSRHWYLQFIGIDPESQGKGYAGVQLRPMLARLDRERTPCFLETQNLVNVPMYEHYGFRVAEKGTVPGSKADHWAMLR